ncbi:hypothetical protein OS493_005733 [Desmophyllum pertusum]|uniref:Uncharacterized protein n=1 Tax=Desmophyllum pertusum TaxID=174260 RepID=A0A9X0CGF9_9CNID|nr:hypothetical protein OS493_005733 [Desmophyllum pertusum]
MAYSLLAAALCIIAMSCFSVNHIAVMAQSENCEYIENTSDKCRSANFIQVEEQIVNKGETKRIKLPASKTEVRWYCGSSEERTAWNTPGNQLRVMYQSDGSIRWSVYKCADLSGPKKAGLKCAVPETTEFCPKFDGANSSACIFELKKSTSHVNQKTTTTSITGTLRAEVEKQAGPLTAKASAEVTAGVSHSTTKAKIVTYESRQFLVIPPGFSFCAFTNNTSVPDVNAPTGFRWRCSFPSYIKAEERFSNGRCTSLEICAVGVCGRAVESGGDSVHIGLTALIVCLIAFLRI